MNQLPGRIFVQRQLLPISRIFRAGMAGNGGELQRAYSQFQEGSQERIGLRLGLDQQVIAEKDTMTVVVQVPVRNVIRVDDLRLIPNREVSRPRAGRGRVHSRAEANSRSAPAGRAS